MGRGIEPTREDYAQVFLYRVPRTNHDAFADAEGKLAEIFRRCGVVRSEFYVLGEGRIFKGFQDLRAVVQATPDEEVWVEVDTYRSREDSIQVIGKIGQDPASGPLFARVVQLATPNVLSGQGNGERVHP